MAWRMAIIGCGGMANTHARRFEEQGERVQLTAAVDIELPKAQAVAALVPGAQAFADFHDALPLVDAVLIAAPHHLHHAITKDCLEAGKHVLLEKPMANSEAECRDLIATAARVQRTLMIAYCQRFNPLVLKVKELIDARAYGPCFQLSIWTEQHTERAPDNWMCRAGTLGGGQLFSHGCHYIDLLLWMLGRPMQGTHTGTNFGTSWMEREGTSHVSLKFASGALGYHFGTWGARGTRLRYAIHAHCLKGMIEADLHGGKVMVHQGREVQTLLDAPTQKNTVEELRHFLDCAESGKPPLTDGHGSLQGLRVIWRLYEAEDRGVVADLRGCGLDEA